MIEIHWAIGRVPSQLCSQADDLIESDFTTKGWSFRGQEKTLFIVKYLGNIANFNFNKEELRQVKWVNQDNLATYQIFPDKYNKTKKLLEEFFKK